MKKLLSILTALTLAVSLAACSGGDKGLTAEKIKEKGTLTVGCSADFPPYEFHDLTGGDDKIVGFDMDLIKAFADELGVKLEIQDMDFDMLVPSLAEGKLDLVISGLTPTEEREKVVDFSKEYFVTQQCVVTKKENIGKFTDEASLKNHKIGVQLGSLQEEIAKKIEGAQLTKYPVIMSLMMELETNKIDAIIIAKPVAEQYLKQYKNFEIVPGIEFKDYEEGSAIAMPKGSDELKKTIDDFIDKVTADGTLQQLLDKNIALSESQNNQ